MTDISKLTKVELEELGREHGIELDRRLTKSTLIEQLEEVITEEPSSLVDLKAEYVEEAPVLKEVVPAPSGQLLTERTRPKQFVDRLFADADGNVFKFATRGAARSTGNRYDGKVLEQDGHFVVRKY
tara:strand:+ start:372 stop:752 length:381 start_codon:yes stop_codon:yes gene_type:complete